MYKTIFIYELKYWLKQPSIYVYAFFLCFLPMLQMAEWAGVMVDKTNANDLVRIANSPNGILMVFNKFMLFILFLLPTIFGRSLSRDFYQNTHALLYSFPIRKKDFLGAKFSVAFLLVLFILGFAGLGILLGANFPGHDPNLVTTFNPIAYLYIYCIYLIPNVLLFGTIVFFIVLFTRNIYAGFISVLLLYFLQMIISSTLSNGNNDFLAAILDPFGQYATSYYTKKWTLTEQNEWMLPFENLVIYNRLLWLGITAILMAWVYRKFQLQQAVPVFKISKLFKNLEVSPPKKSNRLIKENFFHVLTVNLPKVTFDYSLKQQLKTVWQLSNYDLKYILKGGLFFSILIAGIGVVAFKQAEINPAYGYETLPMTWKMLGFPMHNAGITIVILTFLYAGLLVHRSRVANMNGLIDSTPIPNWVLLLSKFLALIKMQMILLSLVLIGGVLVQIISGFYDFEIRHYLFELFGLQLITFVIWAFVAIFVQTVFTNAYLGFFMLLLGWIGTAEMKLVGLDHAVFKYNWGPNFHYSDLTQYGTSLPLYLTYKFYWGLFGLFLLLGTYCWWNRGLNATFLERFKRAVAKANGKIGLAMLTILIAFLSLGSYLWYEDQVLNKRFNKEIRERIEHKMATQFATFKNLPQPKIKSVFAEVNLFPETNDFQIKGKHVLVNTTDKNIDSLLIFSTLYNVTDYHFDQTTNSLLTDTAIVLYGIPVNLELLHLSHPIKSGDTVICHFEVRNLPNTFLRRKSPVINNGTAIQSPIFPRIGYWANEELRSPKDSLASLQMHESKDADWVDFEAVVSTSKNQIALASGDLQRQWTKNNRAFFHYKTSQKIPLYGAFFSAEYAVKRDQWKDIDLAIYHHPQHDYNVDEMIRGLKAALEFNTKNFGEYPLKQAKIVESPGIYGHGGASFSGTMAVSETAGFISKADTTDGLGANMPFFIAVHEFSHQWWKLQLNPAAAKGSDMLMEALCQYTAFKCIEKEFGKTKMTAFLRNERAWYLNGRRYSHQHEPSLLEVENESHINYAKGSMTFYTLSEYIGKKKLNSAIKNFYDKFKLQPAPFATALDLVHEIRQVTPDSLQYLVTDLFEQVTFYDNQILETTIHKTNDENYTIDLHFLISKHHISEEQEKGYRDKNGNFLTYQLSGNEQIISSLPLKDYVEIGIFDENGKDVYLQKHKITQIDNQLKIIVKSRPVKVAIDPYFKLMERDIADNWNLNW